MSLFQKIYYYQKHILVVLASRLSSQDVFYSRECLFQQTQADRPIMLSRLHCFVCFVGSCRNVNDIDHYKSCGTGNLECRSQKDCIPGLGRSSIWIFQQMHLCCICQSRGSLRKSFRRRRRICSAGFGRLLCRDSKLELSGHDVWIQSIGYPTDIWINPYPSKALLFGRDVSQFKSFYIVFFVH